jgi:hypothetical protein
LFQFGNLFEFKICSVSKNFEILKNSRNEKSENETVNKETAKKKKQKKNGRTHNGPRNARKKQARHTRNQSNGPGPGTIGGVRCLFRTNQVGA